MMNILRSRAARKNGSGPPPSRPPSPPPVAQQPTPAPAPPAAAAKPSPGSAALPPPAPATITALTNALTSSGGDAGPLWRLWHGSDAVRALIASESSGRHVVNENEGKGRFSAGIFQVLSTNVPKLAPRFASAFKTLDTALGRALQNVTDLRTNPTAAAAAGLLLMHDTAKALAKSVRLRPDGSLVASQTTGAWNDVVGSINGYLSRQGMAPSTGPKLLLKATWLAGLSTEVIRSLFDKNDKRLADYAKHLGKPGVA